MSRGKAGNILEAQHNQTTTAILSTAIGWFLFLSTPSSNTEVDLVATW